MPLQIIQCIAQQKIREAILRQKIRIKTVMKPITCILEIKELDIYIVRLTTLKSSCSLGVRMRGRSQGIYITVLLLSLIVLSSSDSSRYTSTVHCIGFVHYQQPTMIHKVPHTPGLTRSCQQPTVFITSVSV
jgi:hypothetical protein